LQVTNLAMYHNPTKLLNRATRNKSKSRPSLCC